MTHWFSVNVENKFLSTTMDKIIKKFNKLISITGLSNEAVFIYRHPYVNLTTIYFPPEVETIAKEFRAEACEKPKRDSHLSIVIGRSSCFDHYYPSAQ